MPILRYAPGHLYMTASTYRVRVCLAPILQNCCDAPFSFAAPWLEVWSHPNRSLSCEFLLLHGQLSAFSSSHESALHFKSTSFVLDAPCAGLAGQQVLSWVAQFHCISGPWDADMAMHHQWGLRYDCRLNIGAYGTHRHAA